MGNYPIDELLIRNERRTIHDFHRRCEQGFYVMDPDFQRGFVWKKDKQSKLIESVMMRIPLPVFYAAQDERGRMVVVDGLQRLTTFRRFITDELKLRLPDRDDLNGKKFSELPPKLRNRFEDCNLTYYILDSKAPERVRLDIFERVNGGEALTRQQMRNCLHKGKATEFLKKEAETPNFSKATGSSLSRKTMRDREFVNRFCAFQLLDLDLDKYRGDMDEFLAKCLEQMNEKEEDELGKLSAEFRRGLDNNYMLFGRHSFRKHTREQERRGVLNASLWDVMSTGLSHYSKGQVKAHAERLRKAIYQLLADEKFNDAITYGTGDTKKVKMRFQQSDRIFREILGAQTD